MEKEETPEWGGGMEEDERTTGEGAGRLIGLGEKSERVNCDKPRTNAPRRAKWVQT